MKLAIEIDDESHDMKPDYDQKRTVILNLLGITVLRFTNEDVLKNTEGVLEEIKKNINNMKFFSESLPEEGR